MFKVKLFCLYLRFRKPLVVVVSAISLIAVGANFWLEYQDGRKRSAWQIKEVLSGESLSVVRDDEMLEATLCGIGSENRAFLKSLVDRGDGKVWLQKSGDGFEAWVGLKPDYENQIHLNTEMVLNGKATLVNSSTCMSYEHLKWASKYYEN